MKRMDLYNKLNELNDGMKEKVAPMLEQLPDGNYYIIEEHHPDLYLGSKQHSLDFDEIAITKGVISHRVSRRVVETYPGSLLMDPNGHQTKFAPYFTVRQSFLMETK